MTLWALVSLLSIIAKYLLAARDGSGRDHTVLYMEQAGDTSEAQTRSKTPTKKFNVLSVIAECGKT
jgi:hypothetical protein